jgi:histidine triad (HIT) family protein
VRLERQVSACVFCVIVAGAVRASLVYEDDATVAFVDRRQPHRATGAHVLVVPRRHVETIYDLEPDAGARLMETVIRTARAVRRSLQPAGLSVWQSNGPAAGQEVPHVHFHVLARRPQDGLLRVYPDKPPYPEPAVLDQMAAKISAGIVRAARESTS